MFIRDILKKFSLELKDKNISSYRLDSIILISYFFKISKEKIIIDGDKIEVSNKNFNSISKLFERRKNFEPISHIIGKREFYSIDFQINKDVLDPRPDSEILVEEALKIIKSSKINKILELGTGSGCLIISILKNSSNISGVAVDINKKSLKIAKNNAKSLRLIKKIQFIESNWFKNVKNDIKFDLIISNPPYIASSDIDNLQSEVKKFDPRIALDGGKDGYDSYIEISRNIIDYLDDDGYFVVEIGQNMHKNIIKIFENIGLKFFYYKKDLSEIIRCLIFAKQ